MQHIHDLYYLMSMWRYLIFTWLQTFL